MDNSKAVGKYVVVKDLSLTEFEKDGDGQIRTFDTPDQFVETAFDDALVMKVVGRRIKKAKKDSVCKLDRDPDECSVNLYTVNGCGTCMYFKGTDKTK